MMPIERRDSPRLRSSQRVIMLIDIFIATILVLAIRWLRISSRISTSTSPGERDALGGSDDTTRLIVISLNARPIPSDITIIIIIIDALQSTEEGVDVNRYRRPAVHRRLPAGIVVLIVVLVILFILLVIAQDPRRTAGGSLQIILVEGPRCNAVRVPYVFDRWQGWRDWLAHHLEQRVEPPERGGGKRRTGRPLLVVCLVWVSLIFLLLHELVLELELVLKVVFTTI